MSKLKNDEGLKVGAGEEAVAFILGGKTKGGKFKYDIYFDNSKDSYEVKGTQGSNLAFKVAPGTGSVSLFPS